MHSAVRLFRGGFRALCETRNFGRHTPGRLPVYFRRGCSGAAVNARQGEDGWSAHRHQIGDCDRRRSGSRLSHASLPGAQVKGGNPQSFQCGCGQRPRWLLFSWARWQANKGAGALSSSAPAHRENIPIPAAADSCSKLHCAADGT